MQSIINSIIKYRNLIIYFFLLLFSFNNLYNNSGIHYTKLRNISIGIAGYSANQINNIKSYFNLITENKLLKEENLILKRNELSYSPNNIEHKNNIGISIRDEKVTVQYQNESIKNQPKEKTSSVRKKILKDKIT